MNEVEVFVEDLNAMSDQDVTRQIIISSKFSFLAAGQLTCGQNRKRSATLYPPAKTSSYRVHSFFRIKYLYALSLLACLLTSGLAELSFARDGPQ